MRSSGRALSIATLFATAVALVLTACSVTGAGATSASPSSSPRPSAACTQASKLAQWSTSRLAAQVLVVPTAFTNLSRQKALVKQGIGGLIFFGPSAPRDIGAKIAALNKSAGSVAPLYMADEEGGVVQRLQSIVGPVPSARTQAATMSPAQIKALGTRVGRAMSAAHITVDLAPVLDVDARPGPSATNPDGTRSYSGVPEVASKNGLAFAAGLQAGGAIAAVKHFPGLGGSVGNTDAGRGHTLPWSQLQRVGLRPFTDAIQAHIPVIMVANASVPGLTTLPASISRSVLVTVLRQQLHFGGVIITDSLTAGALTADGYPLNRAVVASLNAGADLLLYGSTGWNTPSMAVNARDAIVSAVAHGQVSRARLLDAVTRVLALKHVKLCTI